MNAGPGAYALVSAVLVGLGLFGVVSRRDSFSVVLSLTLLLLAPVIALVGFAHVGGSGVVAPVGDALALLAVVAAAACAVIGTGFSLVAWRRLGTTDTEALSSIDD